MIIKRKAVLYKIVYKGKVYTSYNKPLLLDYIIGLKLYA